VPIGEDEASAASIGSQHRQKVHRVAAHGMQPDDHRNPLLGPGTARHNLEVGYAGDLTARDVPLLSRVRRRLLAAAPEPVEDHAKTEERTREWN
jgi:hypothetical protein